MECPSVGPPLPTHLDEQRLVGRQRGEDPVEVADREADAGGRKVFIRVALAAAAMEVVAVMGSTGLLIIVLRGFWFGGCVEPWLVWSCALMLEDSSLLWKCWCLQTNMSLKCIV